MFKDLKRIVSVIVLTLMLISSGGSVLAYSNEFSDIALPEREKLNSQIVEYLENNYSKYYNLRDFEFKYLDSEELGGLLEVEVTCYMTLVKVLEQIIEDMSKDEELVIRAKNPIDLFKIIYDDRIMGVVLSRMEKNQEFCEKYLEDEEFRAEIDKILLPLLHDRLTEK